MRKTSSYKSLLPLTVWTMGRKVKLWNRHYQKMKGQISPAQKRQLKKLLYQIRRHTPEKISLIGMQFFWNGRRAVRQMRQKNGRRGKKAIRRGNQIWKR